MARKTESRRRERGSAALELALSLPMMLVIGSGVMEFGRAFSVRHNIVNAATRAAALGAQSSCPRATKAQVVAAAQASLLTEGLEPSRAVIDVSNAGGASGTDIIVGITYRTEFPMLSKLLDLSWAKDGGSELEVRVNAENE